MAFSYVLGHDGQPPGSRLGAGRRRAGSGAASSFYGNTGEPTDSTWAAGGKQAEDAEEASKWRRANVHPTYGVGASQSRHHRAANKVTPTSRDFFPETSSSPDRDRADDLRIYGAEYPPTAGPGRRPPNLRLRISSNGRSGGPKGSPITDVCANRHKYSSPSRIARSGVACEVILHS